MSQNTKTPAMVLQEFAVKNGHQTPEYILIRSKMGTHETEFHYQVNIVDISGIGFGRSKQVAKHAAATKALEILAERGLYDPRRNPVQEFNAQAHRNESDSPMKPQINFIGTLQDMCNDHKLPPPIFVEMSDVGPPHCRVFTYQCQMGSFTTQSVANTKKQAKQLAAREMADKIRDILPELSEQFSNSSSNALLDRETEAIVKHAECLLNLGVVPNRAIAIEDFSLCLKNIMKEKEQTFKDYEELFRERTKEHLEEICNKLEVKYELQELQDDPYLYQMTFGVETPLTVIEIGASKEAAQKKLIESAFQTFYIYMTASETRVC